MSTDRVTVGSSAHSDQTTLAGIEERLARIEGLLVPLAQVAEAAPGGVATLTDMFDGWATRDGRMDARILALQDLLTRLTAPQTLQMLERMLEQAENLPNMVATLTDIADNAAEASARAGMPVEALVQSAASALRGASRLATAPEVKAVFESGILAPKTLQALGQVAQAVGRAPERIRPLGLLGALRVSRDLSVQYALGFLMTVAQSLGGVIAAEQQARGLEARNV